MAARILILLAILLLSGCGEPERPRFTPARVDTPPSSTSQNQPDRAGRGGAIPKNIPMH